MEADWSGHGENECPTDVAQWMARKCRASATHADRVGRCRSCNHVAGGNGQRDPARRIPRLPRSTAGFPTTMAKKSRFVFFHGRRTLFSVVTAARPWLKRK